MFVYAAQVVEYAHAAGIGEMERRAFGYSLRLDTSRVGTVS